MEAAQKYLALWNEENYEGMYQMLSSAAKSNIGQETFLNRYNNIFSSLKLNHLKITAGEISIEDENALLPVKIIFDTETVGSFEDNYVLALIYEEKQWKIEWTPSLIFSMLEPGDETYIARQPPERGFILDKYGDHLACKGPGYEVAGVPGKIPDQEEFAKMLAPLLEVSEEYILTELNRDWVQPDHRVPLRNLPFNITQEFKEELLSIQGVLLSTIEIRQYPHEGLFAHITGYVAPITAEQLEAKTDQDYYPEDLVGYTGLEASMEEELHGQAGYTLFIRNSNKEHKITIAQSPVQDGHDIILAVDPHLQSIISKAMGDKKGTIIAINPGTGEVLAMISKPTYDPNVFPPKIMPSAWEKLSEKEDSPFLNRASGSLYPPGSTIKPFIAAMGLEHQIITSNTIVEEAKNLEWKPSPEWGDYLIRRIEHPEGDINLDRALVWSNNIYFAWLALELGGETIKEYANSYGFGEPLHFPLPTATPQIKNANSDWSPILLANTGYGQGEMLITPLQLATIFTAFANRGDIMQPLLITEIRNVEGQTVNSFSPAIWKEQTISPSSLDIILPSLVNVIEDTTGTGYDARITELTIAGKTGTAQLGSHQEIRWFVVFTLSEDNPLLLCIALEAGEETESSKLDIASEILSRYYQEQ
ncbi:MAG: penicillin-binding transpeptidase domain-containing protein [Candidatus Humimicrobiaceae bacterium]